MISRRSPRLWRRISGIPQSVGGGGVVPDTLVPFLGESLANSNSTSKFRNLAGYSQGKLALHLGADGHWYQSTISWNNAYKAVRSIRRVDQDSWTTYTGTFEPYVQDDDDHYSIVHHWDPYDRTLIIGGVHGNPMRWCMLSASSYTPTSGTAQFNRAWTIGDPTVPIESGATNEGEASYPMLVPFTDGKALFFYRAGSSGEGNLIVKYYTSDASSWAMTTIQNPLINGSVSAVSAYIHHVVVAPDEQKIGLVWNWRVSGVATSTVDKCVAFSPDRGVTWYQDVACTVAQTVPITQANCKTVLSVVADHGMADLGAATFSSDGTQFALAFPMCFNAADVHTSANSPHGGQYHIVYWNGSSWVDKVATSLTNNTWHYPNAGGLGQFRMTPGLVHFNGLWHLYRNAPDATSADDGIIRHTFNSDFSLSSKTQVTAGPGGSGGWGWATAIFDWELLRRTSNRYVALALSKTRDSASAADIGSYVYCEDLSTVPTPSVTGIWQLVTGATVLHAHRSDSVVQSGGFVSQITDLAGNGYHWVQAGATSVQPDYNATGGPNSKPSVSGNGSAKYMTMAWDPAAPGTTPIWRLSIFRQNAWTSGRVLIGGGGTGITEVAQTGVTPELWVRNNTFQATGIAATIGAWFVMIEYYSNSTSDSFRVGSTTQTGTTNLGNLNPTAANLFARVNGGTPSQYANVSWCEDVTCSGVPSNVAALLSAIGTYYGGVVST